MTQREKAIIRGYEHELRETFKTCQQHFGKESIHTQTSLAKLGAIKQLETILGI